VGGADGGEGAAAGVTRVGSDGGGAWHTDAEEVLLGLTEWRLQHPRATLAEIEAAVDEKMVGMRARMVERMALASRAADLAGAPAGERARCTRCGAELRPRGKKTRRLVTQGGQELRLARDYAVCPSCGTGLFPPGRRA
jgi:DNA-directed RNA polymerase subunit RPC12/RpoP